MRPAVIHEELNKLFAKGWATDPQGYLVKLFITKGYDDVFMFLAGHEYDGVMPEITVRANTQMLVKLGDLSDDDTVFIDEKDIEFAAAFEDRFNEVS